jgi:hypothetical protein
MDEVLIIWRAPRAPEEQPGAPSVYEHREAPLEAPPAAAPEAPPAPEHRTGSEVGALEQPLGFRDRGRLRRRARYLRHLREVQVRDLGGFVLELHRFGIWRGDLVGLKISEAAATDRELRALDSVLSEQRSLREVREAGIGGVCGRCGVVHGTLDRFCAACGTPLTPAAAASPEAAAPADAAAPAAPPEAAARAEAAETAERVGTAARPPRRPRRTTR